MFDLIIGIFLFTAVVQKPTPIPVTLISVESPNAYPPRRHRYLTRLAFQELNKKLPVKLYIAAHQVVPEPRKFGTTPNERGAQLNHYKAIAPAGVVLIIAPPMVFDEEHTAMGGVATVICGNGVALINVAYYDNKFLREGFEKSAVALAQHEVLHLLGGRHTPGEDIMGLNFQSAVVWKRIGRMPVLPETVQQVNECVMSGALSLR